MMSMTGGDGKLNYGNGSIFQDKDGKWYAVYTHNNYTKKFTSSVTNQRGRGIVKKKLDDYIKNIKANENLINEPATKKQTFEAFASYWLNKVKINTLKPSSFDRLESTLREHINPYIGDTPIEEIKTHDIQIQVINRMKNKNMSLSSIKKAYDCINACFKYAVKIKYIDSNPTEGVELPAKHKFNKKEIKALTANERARLKNTCMSTYGNGELIFKLGYAFIFIMNTGIREGEAAGLKWSDIKKYKDDKGVWKYYIEIKRNVVQVKERDGEKKTKIIVQSFLKTETSHRKIPLNTTAINCLKEIKNRNYYEHDGFVLMTKNGNIYTPLQLIACFKRIVYAAELKDCTIHTLRHTFASTLFEKGIDVKTVSELLGHSNVNITLNTYVHIINGQKIKAMEIIDEI